MKKLISCLVLVMACGCLLCGCGDIPRSEELKLSSQFKLLDEYDKTSGLCYDKDTKIIYIYSSNASYGGCRSISYTPYYVMNTNNEPVVAVFNGDDFYEYE
jgi:hypothetical protein